MKQLLSFLIWSTLAITSGSVLLLAAAFLYLNPQVPEIEEFRNVKIRAPLRIYSADDKLIQEFGERLIPVTYEEIPPSFIQALLNTEDKRFFEHSGIDLITLVNASWQLVRNKGEIKTGASTITMQLVKNISGSAEVRFIRKFREMLLAVKLDNELSKEEILTLYLNIIPFGKHAFGVQAAANTYYGKDLSELSLAQIAMLAGIPKAPEAGNPVNGPQRALERRNLVLRRMLEQGSITLPEYEVASSDPITAQVYKREIELPALYAAEMVRKRLLTDYGRNAYNEGLIVQTTIDSNMQMAAENALTGQLLAYDRRHGYRGPEHHKLQGTDEYLVAPDYGYPGNWVATLENATVYGNQHPAIVTAITDEQIEVIDKNLITITIPFEQMKWARPYLSVNSRGPRPKTPADIVAVGDLIRVSPVEDGWQLGQIPDIQGALVALAPDTGAVRALVGGFDFNYRQFNHVTQARRQPGSNFKPFFYAGALEEGLTAASIYNDAPIVLPGGDLEETYRPSNSGDVFRGNIRLREALYRSINLVSLRVILDFGPENAINYVSRFGFDTSQFPANVQLAFGGGTIALTPIEVATGYATFANGGHKVEPHIITSITSINDTVSFHTSAPQVCRAICDESVPQAPQVIEPRVAYIMDSILSDVIRRGTGTKAMRTLKRSDLRGKTGTTNDADIWFSGYQRDLVATTWAGFGNNSPVGNREWGSTVPLESWMDFMAKVLPEENSENNLIQPDGLVTVKIDPKTGLRADPADPDGIFEIFREELAPTATAALAKKEEKATESLQQIF